MSIKVEKILKGSLDWIPSPSRSAKIQIMCGKVCLRFPANNLNFHSRWGWWDWIQAVFLNLFYFNIQLVCSEKAKKINSNGDRGKRKEKRKENTIWNLLLGRYLFMLIFPPHNVWWERGPLTYSWFRQTKISSKMSSKIFVKKIGQKIGKNQNFTYPAGCMDLKRKENNKAAQTWGR